MMNKLVVQPVSFQKYSNLGSIESTAMFYVPQTGEEQQLVLGQARQFSQNYQQEGTLLCRGTPIPVFELLEYVKKSISMTIDILIQAKKYFVPE